MPMTHIPEIGADNRYQKTVTGFLTRLTCNLVPNYSGTGFRRRYLVCAISGTCVMGIRLWKQRDCRSLVVWRPTSVLVRTVTSLSVSVMIVVGMWLSCGGLSVPRRASLQARVDIRPTDATPPSPISASKGHGYRRRPGSTGSIAA